MKHEIYKVITQGKLNLDSGFLILALKKDLIILFANVLTPETTLAATERGRICRIS